MWNRLVEGGPADLDALGGQQAAVAVVTEQDQFLTLCSQTLQTPISADGQPDDLHTRTHGQMDLCEQKPSEFCVTFDPNQPADILEKWHWVGFAWNNVQYFLFMAEPLRRLCHCFEKPNANKHAFCASLVFYWLFFFFRTFFLLNIYNDINTQETHWYKNIHKPPSPYMFTMTLLYILVMFSMIFAKK